ncbi:glyoxylase-like metal-dependent hydrolase (beta-lactamase superfamily II) [Desulfitispora alkaliphila]|uniref:hydroxyacylglutathione hydrolase family protein n=1 Tax=Desulfitispora alkaliphila TaxID=622674 RepID=UPI003D20B19C
MLIRQFDCGGGRNLGYVIADEHVGTCALIDPSPEPEALLEFVSKKNFKVKYLINTHGHWDHTRGNKDILEKFAPAPQIIKYGYKGEFVLGSFKGQILHTPGHTDDSICVLVPGNLFTGDTIFVGRIGGTVNREDAEKQFCSLKRLMSLNDHIVIWPGHDYGEEVSSTVKHERLYNPFCVRLNDFESFFDLKENWEKYKKEHGID